MSRIRLARSGAPAASQSLLLMLMLILLLLALDAHHVLEARRIHPDQSVLSVTNVEPLHRTM
jgi:hypothetical protein